MDPIKAETLALKALAYLAQSDEELERFVAISGVTPANLRARAGEPEILAAVLDFVLADDGRVTGFCEAAEIDPRELHAARRALPGA
ncbi:MAG TPA: DUF3572 domain-containing protein [Rhizomicrobium sp.]|nr:DUF3572 domain-containing protein [Rhizomicrobium sp.]